MAHAPIVPLGHHRFVGVSALPMVDVPLVVVVTHQGAAVPTDLACGRGKASHCLLTSFSAAVGIMPEGAKIRDGTGSSALSGGPPPRITLSATMIPATNTMTTSAAKITDRVPWMNVLRMTASIWSAFLAAPNAVLPASLALTY